MRRRRGLLFVAIAAALLLLLQFVLNLLGGSSRTESQREAALPPPPPPAEAPDAPPPPPPTVAGQVLDETGAPLEGASVHIVILDEGERSEVNVRTDAEGRFSDASVGRGKVIFVEVLERGHPTLRRRPQDLAIGRESMRLDLRFPATFDLSGHVKVAGGGAVVGARVSLGDLYGAETDDRGIFRIKGIDSRILRGDPPRLRTRAEGFGDDEQDLGLDGPHANFEDIEVVLERRER